MYSIQTAMARCFMSNLSLSALACLLATTAALPTSVIVTGGNNTYGSNRTTGVSVNHGNHTGILPPIPPVLGESDTTPGYGTGIDSGTAGGIFAGVAAILAMVWVLICCGRNGRYPWMQQRSQRWHRGRDARRQRHSKAEILSRPLSSRDAAW